MKCRIETIRGIEVKIIKKKNLKNLYLRVNPPDGEVKVTAPYNYSHEKMKLFIEKNLSKIIFARQKIIEYTAKTKKEYISGEVHYLWGKPYILQVKNDTNNCKIKETENEILMRVPKDATREKREKLLNEWYRAKLTDELKIVVNKIESKINLYAKEYRIKNMKTKWGTCNVNKKRIWINLQLAKKPIKCLEYVITHELVHLIEKNHNKRFYELVERYYPLWQDAEKILKQI